MNRFVFVLPTVAVVAGCAAASSGATTAPATTRTAPTTTTAGVTDAATAAFGTTASSADTDLATRLAALACQLYVNAGTLSAAEGAARLDAAASTMTSAAVVDPSWTDLAGALAFVAALPLTDVAPEDQDRAATQIAVVQERCGDAGVTVG